MTVRYLHVADDLRRRIMTGVIPADSMLPPEQELAIEYQVGKPTLRRALEVLQGEGFVEKFHGRGNFARQPFQRTTYLAGWRPADRGDGGGATGIEIAVQEVQARRYVSSLLKVPEGTPLVEYAILAEQDGMPRSWARVYLPAELSVTRLVEARSPWGDDITELLTSAGIQFVVTTERITARAPDAEEMRALRIAAWTSVLAIERSLIDISGRVVETILLTLPGDRAEVRLAAPAAFGTEAGR
ncbi:GntR family transcriptional regulator [Kitasatospora camelliae]|uniref:GntR family transcriptional regulator n=1 Tax=Kitasatospora camelliae TaxID=3156397 RepID=A0AAU8K1V0_9ACTN